MDKIKTPYQSPECDFFKPMTDIRLCSESSTGTIDNFLIDPGYVF